MNNSNFLIEACEKITTYITPKKVVDFIEKEKIKSIIQNPPYVVRKNTK
jgi:methylase of polypeptide subunit release factors